MIDNLQYYILLFAVIVVVSITMYIGFPKKCKPGTYSVNGKMPGWWRSCTECKSGEFNNVSGATSCDKCKPGTYNNEYGMSKCNKCRAGTYNNKPGSIQCENCLEGAYNDTKGATSCKNCQPGTYADELGSEICQSCPLGSYSSVENSRSCTLCGNDTYSSVKGSIKCNDCTSGEKSGKGYSECTPCKEGQEWIKTTTTSIGKKPLRTCVACEPGSFLKTYRGVTKCASCDYGKYQDTSGQMECNKCPDRVTIGANGGVALTEEQRTLIEGSSSIDDCTTDCKGPGFRMSNGQCEIIPRSTSQVNNMKIPPLRYLWASPNTDATWEQHDGDMCGAFLNDLEAPLKCGGSGGDNVNFRSINKDTDDNLDVMFDKKYSLYDCNGVIKLHDVDPGNNQCVKVKMTEYEDGEFSIHGANGNICSPDGDDYEIKCVSPNKSNNELKPR
jgi:hypothetical protein